MGGVIIKVVDSADITHAVRATIEAPAPTELHMHCASIHLRPHMPASYYAAQGYAIVLTPEAVQHLVELLERNGMWPIPVRRVDTLWGG